MSIIRKAKNGEPGGTQARDRTVRIQKDLHCKDQQDENATWQGAPNI